MKRILLILAVLVMSISAANAQKVKETSRYAIKGTDTLYVDRHVNLSKVKGDLIPTMIYMYGGGWAFGGRGGDFSYLTDIGVQVISIDYRKGLTKYGYNPAPPEAMEKAIYMALDDLTDAMVIVSPLLAKSAIVIMNDALHKKEGNL
jgi:acetyl esterase/lipase